jgi:hypothetical protein
MQKRSWPPHFASGAELWRRAVAMHVDRHHAASRLEPRVQVVAGRINLYCGAVKPIQWEQSTGKLNGFRLFAEP